MKFRIDLKILIFLLIFCLTNQLELYIIIMIFCLIHELGHLIIGMLLGFKVKEFEIMPVGFLVTFDINVTGCNKKIFKSNITELKRIFVILAGPLVNLITLFIFIKSDVLSSIKELAIYSNLLIILFNLIPIYPLDGGRFLSSMMKLIAGNRNANKIINQISNIAMVLLTMVSSIAIFYFENISILFIIMYLWFLTYNENKKYKMKENVYKSIDNSNHTQD